MSVVDNSWSFSSNFPGSNIVWESDQGILFASDFNSTNATAGTTYRVDLTIADSVGMTRDIYFSFTIASN